MPRIIAIDFGEKRCGIAWTDPLKMIATGLEAIGTDKILTRLIEIVAKENIEEIIVGDPQDFSGNETHGTKPARDFSEKLKKQFPTIVVTLFDERFTSKMATQAMITGGANKKQRQNKGMVDLVSAVILLQSYLEQKV